MAVRSEESEADAMKGFVDAHVASGGGSVIGGEDIAAKGRGDNNQH